VEIIFELSDCEFEIPLYQTLLVVAFLISIFPGSKIKQRRSWITFLTVSVIIEIVVNNYLACVYNSNVIAINCFTLIIIGFYLNFYHDTIETYFKISIKKILILYFLFAMIIVFYCNLNKFQSIPYLLGLVLSTTVISIFIFNLVLTTNKIASVIKAPRFWLGLGIILFTAVNFPYLLHLKEIQYDVVIGLSLYRVLQVSNIFLSFSYLICSLCLLQKTFY